MEHTLTEITDYLLRQSWQIAAVFVLVAVGCWALRKASAHWRYLLWLVVLAKCLTPPLVTLPVPVLPQAQPQSIELAQAPQADPVLPAADTPALTDGLSEASVSAIEAPSYATPEPADAYRPPVAAVEPAAPVEAQPRMTATRWGAFGWIAGAAAFGMFALFKAFWIQRRLKRTRRPITGELRDEVTELAHRLGLRGTPKVWLIDGIGQPFVWGLLRGSIYLPGDFAGTEPAEHRRAILMHELAHVSRYDAAVNAIQILVQGIFFFHPLTWWANRKIRQEREKCCDETAIAALAARPKQYSTAIVDILVNEYKSARPISSLAVAGPTKNIEERIKTIMKPNKRFYKRPTWLAIVTVLLLAALSVPTALTLTARAEKPATPDKEITVPPAAATQPAFRSSDTVPTQRKIEGGVVDADGKPVADAEILVLKMGPHYIGTEYPFEQEIVARTQSDADGKFFVVVTGLSEEVYLYAVARKRGTGFGYSQTVGFPARDGKPRMITLRKAATLNGAVVDEAGQPVADAEVRADLFHKNTDPDVLGCPNLDWFAVRTGQDGRFTIPGVPTDHKAEFIVRAAGRGTVTTRKSTNEAPKYRAGQNIRIVLPPQCRIEGVVIDESTGKPVEDVQLIATCGAPRPPALTKADKDGRFVMNALEPGRWTVALAQQRMLDHAELDQWVAQPVVVDLAVKESQSIRVELSRGEIVEVALFDATGAPVRGRLRVTTFEEEGWWSQVWGSWVSDDNGIVLMRLLPGRYTLMASDYHPVGHSGQESPRRLHGRVDLTVVEHGKSQRIQVQLELEQEVAEKDALKARLINWVEDFFSKNYRDITARKTLKWGAPESLPNGNLSIRYKYLATIWNKDKQIIEQRFTFGPEGKFISADTIEKAPATQPAVVE